MGLTDSSGLSAADIAAVVGNGNGGFGFGNEGGAWWILILFLFAFMGNGFGYGGGSGPYTMNVDATMQRGFDQSALINGINGLNTAVNTGFSNAAIGRCNSDMAMMQGFNGITSQMMANEMARQQCCCETKQAIGDLKYTVATENCADRAAVSDGIRDVLAAINASTQTVIDKMCQQEIEALKARNSELQTQVTMQNLAASQAVQTSQILQDNSAQTAQLINRIAPYPVPSYSVPNPYVNGCYQNGCGCGTLA